MGEHNCSSMRKIYRYVNLELQITLCVNKNFYLITILLAIIIFNSQIMQLKILLPKLNFFAYIAVIDIPIL